MIYSLLYISKTLLELPEAQTQLAEITVFSQNRNAQLGITGALISTASYFSQVLEGERAAVELLMQSIADDPRHMRVKILRTAQEERRFASWAMAYSGDGKIIDRHITPLFSQLNKAIAASLSLRLIGLMQEFAALPQG